MSDEYPHIPPHIRAWIRTEEGSQDVVQIVSAVLFDTTTVRTSTEVRELIEAAYHAAVADSVD